WVFWGLLIPVMYLFAVRVARRRWSWARTVAAHAALATLLIALATLFHAVWFHKGISNAFRASGILSLFTYGAMLGGVLAYYYAQAYVEREVEFAGAKLHALESQLRPHFMFNSLNSVAMLVRGGRGTEAVEMIARLADL